MERKNLIGSALTVRGRSGRSNRAASHRGIRLAPLLLVAVMLAAVAMLAETSNPSRTAHAHDAGRTHTHGNVICVSPPAASCPTYDDEAQPERTIWSTTMTVGISIVTEGAVVQTAAGYGPTHGSIGSTEFTHNGTTYSIATIRTFKETVSGTVTADVLSVGTSSLPPVAFGSELVLELNGKRVLVSAAVRTTSSYTWENPGITWAENESIAVKIIEVPPPNAYGYRTIWTALMTVEQHPSQTTYFGRHGDDYGKITNDTIVDGRTDRGVIDDQFRYPWSGYKIVALVELGTFLQVEFDSASSPSADELAGWTLVLGGKELPFADATPVHASTPHRLKFTSYDPNWAAGDQVVVSIRTKDVQNRVGRVIFKAGDASHDGKVHRVSREWPSGSSYILPGTLGRRDPSAANFSVAGHTFTLETLEVLRKGTDDEDPVWITATFRAPNEGISWTGYWEGEFEQFHTLFLWWYDNINKRPITYTLPLRSAATEGGIQRRGRNVSFVWVRTHKEFERRGLALAKQGHIYADMLAPPQPATARSTTTIQNAGSQHGLYTPAPTVTSVEITSNPGDDQTYGPGDVIQATVTFDQEVTVRYVGSKRQAASLELEMNGETRTAYYERTDGKKVIFEYTVLPGDEAPVALKLPLNSLKLFSERGRQDGSIQNSEGTDAVLDHYGLADTGHRVDAVRPEFASAQVSNDGTQVAVTFNEGIESPAILRAFGVQTSLLQSLALDVRVDGEIAVRSDAAVSRETRSTLTVSEPITQGQTVDRVLRQPLYRDR